MSNKSDYRLSKQERKNITKSRKFARTLTKDGDVFADVAGKEARRVKQGRY